MNGNSIKSTLRIREGSSIVCCGSHVQRENPRWLLEAVRPREGPSLGQGSAVVTLQSPLLQATEREVLWAMRTSMLVFGAGAASLAFYSNSIYDLWFLSGELVYALLFPQLCCALFAPSSNTYGSAAGFLVGLLLRLLAGEPALKIPPTICYPACSLLGGSYVQLFPYKTFTMLLTLGTIIAVSYLATVLFQRNLLPRRWDVCNVLGETSTHTPLHQMDKQIGLQTVPLEENRD